MGSSVSSLEAAQAFSTLLTDKPVDENVDAILSCALGNVNMTQALPIETVRVMRHIYTRNFAFLLYKCIAQVSKVAEARHTLNSSSEAPSEYTSAIAMTRFETSLRILQHLMPVALESGEAALPSTRPADEQAPSSNPPSGAPAARRGTTQPSLEDVTARPRTQATVHFQRLFFVEGKTCDDANPDEAFPRFPRQLPVQSDEGPTTFASYLVWALVECCFIRHITLPAKAQVPESPQLSVTHSEVHQELLWYAGLATEEIPNKSLASGASCVAKHKVAPTMHTTRKELLMTLVGVLSTPLYHPVGFRDELFSEPALSVSVVPLLPSLATSLLNAVLTYDPYGTMPYSSHFVSDEENVIITGVRLLCAMLCYPGAPVVKPAATATVTAAAENRGKAQQLVTESQPVFAAEQTEEETPEGEKEGKPVTHSRDSEESPQQGGHHKTQAEHLMASDPDAPPSPLQESMQPPPPSAPPLPQHKPRETVVRRIHSVRKTVFEVTFTEAGLLLRKLRPIIGLKMYVRQTILPDSQRGIASHDDFMMLLWKLIDLSPAVSSIFASDSQVLTYLLPLVEYAMDARGNPSHTHRLQLVLFILLRLSAFRSFAIRCNHPFTEQIPFPFPPLAQPATYNDLLVAAFCVLTDLNEPAFAGLIPSCTTVVANLAPYIDPLGRTASALLATSFTSVAHRCLRSKEAVCSGADGLVLVNLCESAASVLQYHQTGSHHLIVALAQHRGLLQRLVDTFLVHKTKSVQTASPTPFLVDTLHAAVTAAHPLIESARVNNGTAGRDSAVNTTSSTAIVSGLKYDEEAAVVKLKDLTLVGVLPTPHRIIVRRFHSSRETDEWATVTSWTTYYIDLPLGYAGDNVSIKLFSFEQPA